jgi:HEPN domain-containing protein
MDEERLELTRVWLIKAQHDLAAAKRLAQGNDPVLDVAIYHCQQAAEKALKGLLVYRNIPFEKIHDLKVLIGLALPVAPTLYGLIEKADHLTDYATEYRYPGELLEPDAAEFSQALDDAESIYRTILTLLPGMQLG